jgi:hypothetical protein
MARRESTMNTVRRTIIYMTQYSANYHPSCSPFLSGQIFRYKLTVELPRPRKTRYGKKNFTAQSYMESFNFWQLQKVYFYMLRYGEYPSPTHQR